MAGVMRSTPTADRARSSATRTWAGVARVGLHWLLVAAALAYFAYQVPQLVRSASAAAGEFADLSWGWVAAAVASNLAAVAVYAELHRELLRVGGARVAVSTTQSITFVENAISNTVPVVGGAGAIAYAISRFRRRGVDAALAAWAVLISGVLSTMCLVALAAIALAAVGRLPVFGAGPAVLAVCAVGVGSWMLVTHPALLRALLRPLLSLGRFVPGQCAICRRRRMADVDRFAYRVSGRLARLRPSPLQWSYLVALAVVAWALDFADLVMSSVAALGPVPWVALVFGFLAVQASIALQVVPGGAGLAEVGLLGALHSSGVAAGPAAISVLVYRTSSWLVPSALGWIIYGLQIHLIRPRPHHHGFGPSNHMTATR
jgi:uncharacterized membrane protein YbhN (UPF0104 family)